MRSNALVRIYADDLRTLEAFASLAAFLPPEKRALHLAERAARLAERVRTALEKP